MPPDPLLFALPLACGAVVFVSLAALTVFRYIEPADVVADYDRCAEGWHEAKLMCPNCTDPYAGLCRVPQQPINTYSNLVYVFWGVLLAGALGTGPAWVFALAMTYLCVGSMLYHAISTEWAHVVDETGMYGVYTVLAVFAVATALGWHRPWPAAAMLGLAGVAMYVFGSLFEEGPGAGEQRRHLTKSPYRNWVIGALLAIAVLLPLLDYQRTWGYVVAAVVLFALAFGVWHLDRARRFPLIGGRAWGHAVWHLLTAPATALLFEANRMSGL